MQTFYFESLLKKRLSKERVTFSELHDPILQPRKALTLAGCSLRLRRSYGVRCKHYLMEYGSNDKARKTTGYSGVENRRSVNIFLLLRLAFVIAREDIDEDVHLQSEIQMTGA